jgi:WD40 repeat protein
VSRWDLATGHREPLFSWASDPKLPLGIGIASPDGELLLVPAADWSLEVRRRDGGKPMMLRGHTTVISHVEYSHDSKLLYTSSFDGTLRRWNLATGESEILIDGTVPVSGFAVAADGRVAAQVGDAAKLVSPDGKITELGQGQSWCVNYAEFDKVRDRLLIRRCNLSLVMIDGDRQIELPTDNSHVTRLAVSADGAQIAGAMGDRTIRLWDAQTGQVLRVLRGHTDLPMDVAFSPNGTTLASASYDKTIRVWDLATERHRVLRGHALSVNRVAWRDAQHLVTASRDGTLRVWDVPTMDLPKAADLARQISEATSAEIEVDRPTTRRVPRGT